MYGGDGSDLTSSDENSNSENGDLDWESSKIRSQKIRKFSKRGVVGRAGMISGSRSSNSVRWGW